MSLITCQNEFNSNTKLNILLLSVINTSSKFGIHPSLSVVNNGTSVRFVCHSYQKPFWNKVGKDWFHYYMEAHYNGMKESIVIHKVTFEDNGTYSCSGMGNSPFTSYADLYVGGKQELCCFS